MAAETLVDQLKSGLDAPICITWELTYACNLECVHCLSSSGRRDPRELTTAQAEAVIDLISAVTSRQINIAFDQLQGTLTRRIADVDAQLFDLAARLEASLDFPDEGYHFVDRDSAWRAVDSVIQSVETLLSDARRGRLIREGAQVVIGDVLEDAGRELASAIGPSAAFIRLDVTREDDWAQAIGRAYQMMTIAAAEVAQIVTPQLHHVKARTHMDLACGINVLDHHVGHHMGRAPLGLL